MEDQLEVGPYLVRRIKKGYYGLLDQASMELVGRVRFVKDDGEDGGHWQFRKPSHPEDNWSGAARLQFAIEEIIADRERDRQFKARALMEAMFRLECRSL
jgi:hypothetical protein